MKTITVKKGCSAVIAEKGSRYMCEDGADLTCILVLDGSADDENGFEFVLAGKGSRVDFLALIAASGKQVLRLKAVARHLGEKTESRLRVHSVLGGGAFLDFRGGIEIAGNASMSDAGMTHRTLLLSPGARVRTLPSMEIAARDAKAHHAATAGKADREALYYLQSRGIGPKQAFDILVSAFLGGPAARINDAAARQIVLSKVNHLVKSIWQSE